MATRPITLIHGARNRAELYYHDLFQALAAKHPNFQLRARAVRPTPAPLGQAAGFVHEARKQFHNDFRGHRAYLCGPPPMIEACIGALMQGRLFERDIYTEKFLTSADGANGRRAARCSVRYELSDSN